MRGRKKFKEGKRIPHKKRCGKVKEQELELTGELREKAEEKCVKERQEQEKKDKLQETGETAETGRGRK